MTSFFNLKIIIESNTDGKLFRCKENVFESQELQKINKRLFVTTVSVVNDRLQFLHKEFNRIR